MIAPTFPDTGPSHGWGAGEEPIPYWNGQLPAGAAVWGYAPIGVRWDGVVSRDGAIRVTAGCPAREFAPVGCTVRGTYYLIRDGYPKK